MTFDELGLDQTENHPQSAAGQVGLESRGKVCFNRL